VGAFGRSQYRWEFYGYGLPDGYDKLVASDIVALLIEALKGIGVAGNKLSHARLKADDHTPAIQNPHDQEPHWDQVLTDGRPGYR
jgi:hypothetical protein